jgi:acid stress-induced BolA-like protein IbaG/YrbA
MVMGTSDSIVESLRQAVLAAIPDAQVEVHANSPGHFQLRVVSPLFAGKSMVQQQQLVYASIADLMRGDNAPVHAIDRLQTATA